MKFQELQKKDVVSINDGVKLGKIYDLEINVQSGAIENVIIQENLKLSNLFSSSNCIELPFDCIDKIGEEVIIVKA